jgi:hypothetical protein
MPGKSPELLRRQTLWRELRSQRRTPLNSPDAERKIKDDDDDTQATKSEGLAGLNPTPPKMEAPDGLKTPRKLSYGGQSTTKRTYDDKDQAPTAETQIGLITPKKEGLFDGYDRGFRVKNETQAGPNVLTPKKDGLLKPTGRWSPTMEGEQESQQNQDVIDDDDCDDDHVINDDDCGDYVIDVDDDHVINDDDCGDDDGDVIDDDDCDDDHVINDDDCGDDVIDVVDDHVINDDDCGDDDDDDGDDQRRTRDGDDDDDDDNQATKSEGLAGLNPTPPKMEAPDGLITPSKLSYGGQSTEKRTYDDKNQATKSEGQAGLTLICMPPAMEAQDGDDDAVDCDADDDGGDGNDDDAKSQAPKSEGPARYDDDDGDAGLTPTPPTMEAQGGLITPKKDEIFDGTIPAPPVLKEAKENANARGAKLTLTVLDYRTWACKWKHQEGWDPGAVPSNRVKRKLDTQKKRSWTKIKGLWVASEVLGKQRKKERSMGYSCRQRELQM